MDNLLNTISLLYNKPFDDLSIRAYKTLEEGKKKNQLVRNFFRYKLIINKITPLISPLITNQDNITNESNVRFISKLQELNILEQSLIYKQYEWFLVDLRWSLSELDLSGSYEYRKKLTSDINMKSVKGKNLVDNYFNVKYSSVNLYDKTKWNYSRYSLLEELVKIKLRLILIILCYEKGKIIDTKSITKSIIKLEEKISYLYKGKLSSWGISEDIYKIKEYQRFNPQIEPITDNEDYARPYEFLFEFGDIDLEELSDTDIIKFIKLGFGEKLLSIPRMKKRIVHIYKTHYKNK